MRGVFFSALVATAMLVAPAAEADEAAIQTVISDQIDAFLANDVNRAFTHASPMIQGMFGTPETFGRMVQNGYPMVWRPDAVTFLGIEDRGQVQTQEVMIRDAQGRLHFLEYDMINGPEGWKINGVRFKPQAPGTA